MQVLIEHEFSKGQYRCLSCHGLDTRIAGRAVTVTHISMHNGDLMPIGVVYEGDCNTCKPEDKK